MQIASKAKLHIRGLGKIIADLEQQIADLKRERYFFEQGIVRDERVKVARKSELTQAWKTKLKRGQSHKKSKLKAAINFL